MESSSIVLHANDEFYPNDVLSFISKTVEKFKQFVKFSCKVARFLPLRFSLAENRVHIHIIFKRYESELNTNRVRESN